MPLIIETGAIVADANSYATVAELRAYADQRHEVLPQSNVECEKALLGAMTWLSKQFSTRFIGRRVSAQQALDWPRMNAALSNGQVLPSELIPRQIFYGQLAAAVRIAQGLAATADRGATTDRQVKSESVGPISITYENTGKVLDVGSFAEAEAQLATLITRGGLFAIRA